MSQDQDKTQIHELYEILKKQVSEISKVQTKNVEGDTRSLFQKEYDRIIFSDYFHSMATKTQVVPSPNNDHTHTRLTHSLEVASLGFSFGKKLLAKFRALPNPEANPLFDDLPLCIATACLVHDIGNPPFGHAGEEAIQEAIKNLFYLQNGQYCYKQETPLNISEKLFKGLTYFDGNAYGFRVLTRLAGGYPSEGLSKTGLNFNPLTLCVYTKYPWEAGEYPNNPEKKKFAYLDTESQIYSKQIIESLKWEPFRRHPLTFLVEAADDICYFIMDCEDGIKNGHLSFSEIHTRFKLNAYIENMKDDDRAKQLKESVEKLKKFDPNKPIFINELKAMEHIRSMVFHEFVDKAFDAYSEEKNLTKILEGDTSFSLFNEIFSSSEAKDNIRKFREEKLYNSLYIHTRKMTMEISGHRVIRELLELCFDALASLKKANFDLKKTETHSKHILRFMGYDLQEYKNIPEDEQVMRAIDFVVQHSDRDLIQIHKQFTDFEFRS